MKIIITFAAVAALTFGQEAKVAPLPAQANAPPSERALSETESLRIQLTIANLKVLQAKHKTEELQKKMEEFQSEAKPVIEEQQSIISTACQSVGVPIEKMQEECGISTGIGEDGRPAVGPDGKPMQARVWKKPPSPKTSAAK